MHDRACFHCGGHSEAFAHTLLETNRFRIVCDIHPLTEGHLLIIPKPHISCIGACDADDFQEFLGHYDTCRKFLLTSYGKVAAFEHGKIGQTVFHSHVHLLPFDGSISAVVPENDVLKKIAGVQTLPEVFANDGQYLFVSISNDNWLVDTKIGVPRFFRDRFAIALGAPERGNWKTMHDDRALMAEADAEIKKVQALWLAARKATSLQ